jgi:hypothetical protein
MGPISRISPYDALYGETSLKIWVGSVLDGTLRLRDARRQIRGIADRVRVGPPYPLPASEAHRQLHGKNVGGEMCRPDDQIAGCCRLVDLHRVAEQVLIGDIDAGRRRDAVAKADRGLDPARIGQARVAVLRIGDRRLVETEAGAQDKIGRQLIRAADRDRDGVVPTLVGYPEGASSA